MPIPFILGAAAILAGGYGVKKAIDAHDDQETANYVNEEAQEIAQKATKLAETSRKNSGKAIESLGKKKIEVLENSVMLFIEIFEQIHNIELSESTELNELRKFKIDKQSIAELKQMGSMASSIASGIASGTTAGAVTAFGAYGAVGALASASTGTAIGALSGAAATNATLAFLGGGSLAAGGLGVAGGTAVLGGLVAGPAIAIMGAVMSSKASANKEKAYTNLAKAKEFAEEMNTVQTLCKGIRMRAEMFEKLLVKLEAIFEPLLLQLDDVITASGTDYSKYTQTERSIVSACLSTVQSIKAILDTPILKEDGSLSPRSLLIANSVKRSIE